MFISALLPDKYDKAAQYKHPDLEQQIQRAVPKSISQDFAFAISAKKPNYVNVPKKCSRKN